MKLSINNPYLIFFSLIPIILLIGILDNQFLSIRIYYNYYGISKSDLSVLISYLFGLIGLGYSLMKIFKRKLIKWLSWMHFGFTFFGLIVVFVMSYLSYYNYYASQDLVFILGALLIIFAQFLYIINIIIGIFRREQSKNFSI